MKPGDRRYTVLWHFSGQPRAYAATLRDFTIKIEWIPYKKREDGEPLDWEPNDLADALVDRAAKGLGSNYKTKEEKAEWHLPTLQSRTKIGPGEWRFKVTEAYTD